MCRSPYLAQAKEDEGQHSQANAYVQRCKSILLEEIGEDRYQSSQKVRPTNGQRALLIWFEWTRKRYNVVLTCHARFFLGFSRFSSNRIIKSTNLSLSDERVCRSGCSETLSRPYGSNISTISSSSRCRQLSTSQSSLLRSL